MLGGPDGDLGPRAEVELIEDVGDVAVDGPLGESQAPGHLTVAKPLSDQPQYLHLALAEPRRPGVPSTSHPVTRRGEHSVRRLAVKAPCPNLRTQLAGRLVGRSCRAVGPRFGECLIHIGDRQDASRERERS